MVVHGRHPQGPGGAGLGRFVLRLPTAVFNDVRNVALVRRRGVDVLRPPAPCLLEAKRRRRDSWLGCGLRVRDLADREGTLMSGIYILLGGIVLIGGLVTLLDGIAYRRQMRERKN